MGGGSVGHFPGGFRLQSLSCGVFSLVVHRFDFMLFNFRMLFNFCYRLLIP